MAIFDLVILSRVLFMRKVLICCKVGISGFESDYFVSKNSYLSSIDGLMTEDLSTSPWTTNGQAKAGF